jgi:hypothetical protein
VRPNSNLRERTGKSRADRTREKHNAVNNWASGSGRLTAASDPTGPKHGLSLGAPVWFRLEASLGLGIRAGSEALNVICNGLLPAQVSGTSSSCIDGMSAASSGSPPLDTRARSFHRRSCQ